MDEITKENMYSTKETGGPGTQKTSIFRGKQNKSSPQRKKKERSSKRRSREDDGVIEAKC